MDPSSRTIQHVGRDELLTFLELSKETGGEYTLIEVDLAPEQAAPAHRHTVQAELFTVVSGTLDVTVDGTTTRLAPGESALAPGGSFHGFSNPGPDRCVYRVRITPGNAGWENMMRISFGLSADGETWGEIPKDFTTLSLLATMGEAELPGPFALLGPLLRWRAKSEASRRRGQELLERYGGTPVEWTTPRH